MREKVNETRKEEEPIQGFNWSSFDIKSLLKFMGLSYEKLYKQILLLTVGLGTKGEIYSPAPISHSSKLRPMALITPHFEAVF